MPGLYLHIPFCKQACHYCDFHFSTNQSQKLEVSKAIARELDLQKGYLTNTHLDTVYFGGGTPSLLSRDEFGHLFSSIQRNFTLHPSAEVTLEANSDDLSDDKLIVLKEVGINRLSIGIQSFSDSVLKFLNRAHDSELAVSSMRIARAAGFANISADLIYAIPGQDATTWERNIRMTIDLEPEHISAYALTIEEKTAFGGWQKKGKLKPVDEDLAASDFETLVSLLTGAGYEHYEVSNFCKPGFHSRHNSSYWRQEHYLGVGPSAHSYNGVSRQFNIGNNALYQKAIGESRIPYELELLSSEDMINEFVFTSLRTGWGCDLAKLKQKFGYDLAHIRGDYIHQLIDQKLATQNQSVLQLTTKGFLLADKIAADLFIETIKK